MVEDYIVEDDVGFDMVEDMMKVPLSMKSFINLRYTYNTLKLGPVFLWICFRVQAPGSAGGGLTVPPVGILKLDPPKLSAGSDQETWELFLRSWEM